MEDQSCDGAYMRTRVLARTHWRLSDLPNKQAPPVQGLREPKEAGSSTGDYEGPSQKHLDLFLARREAQAGSPHLWEEGKRSWLEGSPKAGEVGLCGPLREPQKARSQAVRAIAHQGNTGMGLYRELSLAHCMQSTLFPSN